MAIASLAWTLKVWSGLLLPVSPRWRETHDAERETIVRMDFRTFVQRFIMIPTQIVRSGRRTIYRLLAWHPDLPIFFRLLDAFWPRPELTHWCPARASRTRLNLYGREPLDNAQLERIVRPPAGGGGAPAAYPVRRTVTRPKRPLGNRLFWD